MIREELIKLATKTDEYLALWKIYGNESVSPKNVFLSHGTFSNRKVCMGISTFLVEKGYTCWILEWRNHGDSSETKQPFNFESVGTEDFLIAFEYLFNGIKIRTLHCITHSGGGVCLTMFLIQNPSYISKIRSIAMFGCQAFGAAHNLRNYTKILLGKWIAYLSGGIPARKTGSPHDEDYFMMKQWFDWNLSKKFMGKNNFDYQTLMPKITVPILSVAAKGDTFIAPKAGCEQFLNAFKNPKNRLLFCSKENGFKENYNHSRILHSKNSRAEIYPIVLEWMETLR